MSRKRKQQRRKSTPRARRDWGRLTGGSLWWTRAAYKPRSLVVVLGLRFDWSDPLSPAVICRDVVGLDMPPDKDYGVPLLVFCRVFEYAGQTVKPVDVPQLALPGQSPEGGGKLLIPGGS